MKRKNRDLNIFSMSALDLFASAMGAFIIIGVALLPYYKKPEDPFLVVFISWKESCDVDLFVKDAKGNVFYWDKRKYDDASGVLSSDSTDGPGIEIWEDSQAVKGRYEIFAVLWQPRRNNNAEVSGRLISSFGSKKLSNIALDKERQAKLLATIIVKEDRSVTVDTSEAGKEMPIPEPSS